MRQVALVAIALIAVALPLLPTVAAGNECVSLCVTIPAQAGQTSTYYVYANSIGCPHNGPPGCRVDGLLWQETNSVDGLQTTRSVLWQPDAILVA